MRAVLALLILAAFPVRGEVVLAARTLRAQEIVTASDLRLEPAAVPGALADPGEAIGLETRTVIYEGRPLRPGDLAPPALIERNQIITIRYAMGGLTIEADGRSLARAGAGQLVRVMNLASRSTVTGTVGPDGQVHVGRLP